MNGPACILSESMRQHGSAGLQSWPMSPSRLGRAWEAGLPAEALCVAPGTSLQETDLKQILECEWSCTVTGGKGGV